MQQCHFTKYGRAALSSWTKTCYMQNSLKLNESRRQELEREMVILKNYKKCGLKLYCHKTNCIVIMEYQIAVLMHWTF